MIERIIAQLEKEKTFKTLGSYWHDVCTWALVIEQDEDGSWGPHTSEEAFEEALGTCNYPEGAVRIMWGEVLEKCDRPHIITAEELTDALFSLLPREIMSAEEVIGEAYPAFLNRVRSLLTHRGSRSFAITELSFMAAEDLAVAAECRDEIWSGKGVSVSVSGTGCSDIDPEIGAHDIFFRRDLLYARIWGRISPGALETLADELKGVIRSLIRSVAAAAGRDTDLRTLPVFPTILPYAGVEPVTDEAGFLRMCLDSYFAKPSSKKDSLERRIRNAIALLVEADTQATDAVGIALAVTAVTPHGPGPLGRSSRPEPRRATWSRLRFPRSRPARHPRRFRPRGRAGQIHGVIHDTRFPGRAKRKAANQRPSAAAAPDLRHGRFEPTSIEATVCGSARVSLGGA